MSVPKCGRSSPRGYCCSLCAALVLLILLSHGRLAVTAAAGAVIGHMAPVWLMFRGGKGVATVLGALLVIAWPVGLLSCLTWLVVAGLSRIASLSSLSALAASPFYAWVLADPQRTELAAFLFVLVALAHHANIRRLVRREEPKIDLGKR